MSRKRRQDTELMASPRTKFAKTVQHGTWHEFLFEDANVTRKAFVRWWSEVYLKSADGKALASNIKAQVRGLIESKPPNPISRESLLPGTVSVIQTWESIPLVQGSVEWAKARIRLIRDVIFDGRYEAYQNHFDLDAIPAEMAHARCWMYQRDDGQLDHYRSLAQPWSYKDIEWSNEGPITKLADSTQTAAEFPPVPADPVSNLNRLRISVDDFELHLSALTISARGEQQQQPPQQPPQQHTAETRTADASKRATEASTEVVVQQQQQQHIKEEHVPKGVVDGVIIEPPPIKKEHAREADVKATGAATQQPQIKKECVEEEAGDSDVEIIEPPQIMSEPAHQGDVDGGIIEPPQITNEPTHNGDVAVDGATTQQPQIKKERLEEEAEAGVDEEAGVEDGDSDLEIIEPPQYRD
ncbi:MAG: hypothetical protein L6R36_008836 [Xanthoria steineri]|nr:MAG: hypothetical protein L6R36_008836 [Xanthoria steineri]